MQEDIEDTKLSRGILQNRILRDLYKKWLRVVGKEIPVFDYDEKAKQWNIPIRIMMRVIEETIAEGWLEDFACGLVTLTPKGRKECERRKLDQ